MIPHSFKPVLWKSAVAGVVLLLHGLYVLETDRGTAALLGLLTFYAMVVIALLLRILKALHTTPHPQPFPPVPEDTT